MTDKASRPSDEGDNARPGGEPDHTEAEIETPTTDESRARRDPNDDDREALREAMNDARRMLKRQRAHIEIWGLLECPACGGRIRTEYELIQPSEGSEEEWNESYRYGCERCDFETEAVNVWRPGNDVTPNEYLHGHGFDIFKDDQAEPLRDDAYSQRLFRDSEPRHNKYEAYNKIDGWVDQYGLDFASVCEEVNAAGIIARSDVITEVELEVIRAAMVRVAKGRGRL